MLTPRQLVTRAPAVRARGRLPRVKTRSHWIFMSILQQQKDVRLCITWGSSYDSYFILNFF